MFYYSYIELALLNASEECKNTTFDQPYVLDYSR